MKKSKVMMLALAFVSFGFVPAQAQSLKSILSNVASTVSKTVTGSTTSASSIIGTWNYSAPDCQFESDNLLAKAGGEVVNQQVESKMQTVCDKLGLSSSNCSYTFSEDGSYTQTLAGKTIKGTYTFSDSDQTITMKTSVGLSFTAQVSVSSSTMSLLFEADKMLSLLKTTAGTLSKVSSNSTLSTLTSLSDEYDGLLLGFELKK